jgi:hypothetical protein
MMIGQPQPLPKMETEEVSLASGESLMLQHTVSNEARIDSHSAPPRPVFYPLTPGKNAREADFVQCPITVQLA